MVRSQLRNQFINSRSERDRETCLQRNMCVKLQKKNKRSCAVDAVDNRKFWKTVRSSYSDKSHNFESITLEEND